MRIRRKLRDHSSCQGIVCGIWGAAFSLLPSPFIRSLSPNPGPYTACCGSIIALSEVSRTVPLRSTQKSSPHQETQTRPCPEPRGLCGDREIPAGQGIPFSFPGQEIPLFAESFLKVTEDSLCVPKQGDRRSSCKQLMSWTSFLDHLGPDELLPTCLLKGKGKKKTTGFHLKSVTQGPA